MSIVEERLVALETLCIEWQGSIDSEGYGRHGKRKAHRIAWESAHGPIPVGLLVCHTCDNPPCVNVEHLFLGTIADNNRDRHAKGRSKNLFTSSVDHPAKVRGGERHWQAKLTDVDVRDIRRRYSDGEKQATIAASHGVHSATVSRIARGLWRQEVAA